MACERLDEDWTDPNISSESWTEAKNENKLNDILECYGICGPNHYISLDILGPIVTGECVDCNTLSDIENSEYADQCNSERDVWFQSQTDVNYINRDTDIIGNEDINVGQFNLQELFGGVASSSEFETCMNDLLEYNVSNKTYCNGKSNHEIHEEIALVNNILELQPCHIDYIEDKLKIISTIPLDDSKQCMDILNIAEMFNCGEPISTKMLHISYLIFHIVGLDNLDLSTIRERTPEYYRLTQIIDRLTPYVKHSIKRIIDISKHYEEQTCGRESTTTHILERIYIDLFDKSSEISLNINSMDFIPDYIIKDTNIVEFAKLIISFLAIVLAFWVVLNATRGNSK